MDAHPPDDEKRFSKPRLPISRWLLLAGPPVATMLLASAAGILMLYLIPLGRFALVAVILYLLTPIVSAMWAFRICWRLAASSTVLLIFLLTVELALIFVAFLFNPLLPGIV
jgi:hypothetical protein